MNENKKQIDTFQRVTNSTWIHLNETPFFNEKMMKRYEEIDVNVFLASLLRDFGTPSSPPPKKRNRSLLYYWVFRGERTKGGGGLLFVCSLTPTSPRISSLRHK